MATATYYMIKQEDIIEFRPQSLDDIDAVFKLQDHVVVLPVSLVVGAIFEFDNEGRLGKWLFVRFLSGCLFAFPPLVSLAAASSLHFVPCLAWLIFCSCSWLSFKPKPNSLETKADIIMPRPSSFGTIAFWPLGAVHAFVVKQHCFMIALSWPKPIMDFLSLGLQTLRLPPNLVVAFILSWKPRWSSTWNSTIFSCVIGST